MIKEPEEKIKITVNDDHTISFEEPKKKETKEESKEEQQAKPEESKADQKGADVDDVRRSMSGDFMSRIFGRKEQKVAAQDKPKEEAHAKTADEVKAANKAKDDSKPEGDKPTSRMSTLFPDQEDGKTPEEPKVKDGMTIEEATELAAAAAAKATSRIQQGDKPRTESPQYPDQYAGQAKVFDRMAADNPKKYGDLKKRFSDFATREQEYIALWKGENGDQEFDPEDDQHADFYEKHFPIKDEQDVESAREALRKDEIRSEAKAIADATIQPIIAKQRIERLQPIIERDRVEVVTNLVKAITPKFGENGVTQEAFAKYVEDNPIEAETVNQVAVPVSRMIESYHTIFDGVQNYNPKDPIHAALVDSMQRLQNKISSFPRAKQIRDGKPFVPFEKYVSMPRQEQDQHWTIGSPEVVAWIQDEAVEELKAAWEQRKKVLARYGVKLDDPTSVKNGTQSSPQSKTIQQTSRQVVAAGHDTPARGSIGDTSSGQPSDATKGLPSFLARALKVKT